MRTEAVWLVGLVAPQTHKTGSVAAVSWMGRLAEEGVGQPEPDGDGRVLERLENGGHPWLRGGARPSCPEAVPSSTTLVYLVLVEMSCVLHLNAAS